MSRHAVNKRRSARNFNKHERRSHPKNFMITRGGWRL